MLRWLGKTNFDDINLDIRIVLSPLESLVLPINLCCNSQNLDTSCTLQDLLEWEGKHGMIPDHAVVCLYTGRSKFWGDENNYFGRTKDALQNDTDIHFPGFSPEAAQWLVDER